MEKRILVFCSLFFFVSIAAISQKKIVVVGSSTAAGTGASPIDSAWVNRLQQYFQQNMSDGLDTVVTNLAVGGFTTYDVMPTGSHTSGRNDPDVNHNVTKALSFNPDIIIINLPSNDIANGYTKLETMNNFRLLYHTVVNGGAKCFITTTQPRNFSDVTQRQYQRDLVDSITNNFAVYSINFWDDLVTNDGLYMLKPEVNSGDGIHPNNLGHRLLFQRAQAKNMFNINVVLPLSLTAFTAQLKNHSILLNWHTESEEPASSFEVQKSNDGNNFEKLKVINATGLGGNYSWIDQHPFVGNNFYRLKISEPSKTSYSKIVSINNNTKEFLISRLLITADNMDIEVSSQKNQAIEISIINVAGAIIEKQKNNLMHYYTKISLPISNLAAGEYLVHLTSADGSSDTQKFTKIK